MSFGQYPRPGRILRHAQLNLQPSWGMNEGTGSWMFGVVVPRMQDDWERDRIAGLSVIPEYRSQMRGGSRFSRLIRRPTD